MKFDRLRNSFRAPLPSELCLHWNDLPTRLIGNLKLGPLPVFAVYLSLFLGVKLVINAWNSTLVSPTFADDFREDLTVFPPFALAYGAAAAVLGLLTGTNGQTAPLGLSMSGNAVSIPYLRDYSDIALMTIASFHLTLVHGQWLRISSAFTKLRAERVLNPVVFQEEENEAVVEDANNWFRQKRWNYLAAALSAAAVVRVLPWFADFGIYSGLARPTQAAHGTWEGWAYLGWWANPAVNGWPPIVFSATVYFFFLYYVILHNIIGIGTFRLLWRLAFTRVRGTGTSLFVPQPYHPDGFWGLLVVKVVMQHVALSLLMSGLSIVAMYYYLPSEKVWVVLPFVGLFVFAVVTFLIVSLYLLHRDMGRAKRILLEEALAKIGPLDASISQALSSLGASGGSITALLPELQLWQYHAERYRICAQAPTSLFSFKRSLAYVVTNLIPAIAILRDFFGTTDLVQ